MLLCLRYVRKWQLFRSLPSPSQAHVVTLKMFTPLSFRWIPLVDVCAPIVIDSVAGFTPVL